MMRDLLWCELRRAGRQPAVLWMPLLAHVGTLILFVRAWADGTGVPLWAPRSFYAQARLVDTASLLLVLPWTAARVALPASHDQLVTVSSLAGVAPSRLLAARGLAAVILLTVIAAAGQPILIYAQRMSALAATDVLPDALLVAALILVAVTVAAYGVHVTAKPLYTWLLGMMVSLLLAVTMTSPSFPPLAAILWMVVSGIAYVTLAMRTDTTHRYLKGPA